MKGQKPAPPPSSEAAAPAPETAWYVGRDGQQYGPVADAEFRRMFEVGQLLPTDLVWREGFPEWRQAGSLAATMRPQPPATAPPVRPPVAARAPEVPVAQPSPRGPQAPAADPRLQRPAAASVAAEASGGPQRAAHHHGTQPQAQHAVHPHGTHSHGPHVLKPHVESTLRRRGRKVGRGLAWTAIAVFFTITLAAAWFIVYPYRNEVMNAVMSVIPRTAEAIEKTAPIGGFAASPEATDLALQRSQLLQVLKKYHPEWYANRLRDVSDAVRANRPEAEIAVNLMQEVAKLRRQFAGDAMSAPPARLQSISSLFAANLATLRKLSIDACYQYASNGEAGPAVVALLRSPEHTSELQAQLVATFEAINDGRKTPRVYPQPRQTDFDVLVGVLESKGWKKTDMQLFSNTEAFAKAAPETVCRLVAEWFESQLLVSDPSVQLRLIVDSLRPVVAG